VRGGLRLAGVRMWVRGVSCCAWCGGCPCPGRALLERGEFILLSIHRGRPRVSRAARDGTGCWWVRRQGDTKAGGGRRVGGGGGGGGGGVGGASDMAARESVRRVARWSAAGVRACVGARCLMLCVVWRLSLSRGGPCWSEVNSPQHTQGPTQSQPRGEGRDGMLVVVAEGRPRTTGHEESRMLRLL
jgi:hypothetical protein